VRIPIVDVFRRYSRQDFLQLQLVAVITSLSLLAWPVLGHRPGWSFDARANVTPSQGEYFPTRRE
jgi:hypothetical protein